MPVVMGVSWGMVCNPLGKANLAVSVENVFLLICLK